MSADRLCGLERMGVLLNLAATIYYAQALLDRHDPPHFNALPAVIKHHYLELAIADMDRRPAAAARPPLDPDSSSPSGRGIASPGRPNWFDRACDEARAAGKRVLTFRDPVIDGRD